MNLGVNIDHVATLRQQRKGKFPDVVYAGLVAQAHGADHIVAHLREDRRHIQERDVRILRQVLSIPLSLEMAATEAMERFAEELLPQRVCLVPEKREELTTEGGLDLLAHRTALKKIVSRLSAKKIEISLFIDADADQVKCAAALGANTVELHTGHYADAPTAQAQKNELVALQKAAELAVRLKLNLHAGHGLDYKNVLPIARLIGMQELNIGFSIVSQAVFIGLAAAVSEMKQLLERS